MDEKDVYPPGLVLHGTTYRIQKRIPKDCAEHYPGLTHLRFRTATADKKEAAALAWPWFARWEQEFDRIRSTGAGSEVRSAMRTSFASSGR